jgi:hypothetical protein
MSHYSLFIVAGVELDGAALPSATVALAPMISRPRASQLALHLRKQVED